MRQSGEVSNRDSNRDYHKSAVRHSHKDFNMVYNKDSSKDCKAF